jgi:hypothetical protein
MGLCGDDLQVDIAVGTGELLPNAGRAQDDSSLAVRAVAA